MSTLSFNSIYPKPVGALNTDPYSNNNYSPSLVGTLIFPGRKSVLPASTVPEYPAQAYPVLNYPGSDYSKAGYPVNTILGFGGPPYNPNISESEQTSSVIPGYTGSNYFNAANPVNYDNSYSSSLVGTLIFPGRKSVLPASTVPEYPAQAYPVLNYPGSDYSNAAYPVNTILGFGGSPYNPNISWQARSFTQNYPAHSSPAPAQRFTNNQSLNQLLNSLIQMLSGFFRN